MDKILSCQVCSQMYEATVRDPVMLPDCGHTFCRPCLVNIKRAKKKLKCPTCKKKYTGIDVAQLAVNFLALNLVESHKQAQVQAMADPEPTISEGSPKQKVLIVNLCSVHGDPLKLWCCSCQKDICGQCLYELHMGESHTVVSAQDFGEELQIETDIRVTSVLKLLEMKKEDLEGKLHQITLRLSQVYKESIMVHKSENKVTFILSMASGSATGVKYKVKCSNRLQELQTRVEDMLDENRPRMFPNSSEENAGQKELIAGSVLENLCELKNQQVMGNVEVTDDGKESLANKNQESDLWPLADYAPGGSNQWPMINWEDFVQKLPIVNLLVTLKNPKVSLLLSHGQTNIGCVTVKLWGHLRRAQQFLMLCMGTLGPSYKGMPFNSVERKRQPGEALVGGDYKFQNETQRRGLLSDLEWGGCHSSDYRSGVVAAWNNGNPEFDTWFAITTKTLPGSILPCVFGEVVSGMDVVEYVVQNYNPNEVAIAGIRLL